MMPMKMIVDLETPSAHFTARSEWSAPIRKEEIPRKYHICPSINVAISMWKYIQGNICGNIITVCGCSMRRWITGSNIRKYQEIKWKCKGNAKEMQGNSRKCKEMPGNVRKCKDMQRHARTCKDMQRKYQEMPRIFLLLVVRGQNDVVLESWLMCHHNPLSPWLKGGLTILALYCIVSLPGKYNIF